MKEYSTPTISSADGKCLLKILSPQHPLPPAEWYEMTIEAGGKLESDAHLQGTMEHLTVQSGRLQVRLPTHEMTLSLYLLFAVIVLVVITIALFWRVRKLAAVLLIPYLAWVCFATALNYQFLQLNPDADGGNADGAVERVRI